MVIDLLLAHAANDEEWQNAIDLYQIVGLEEVMKYIAELLSLRQYFGTPVVMAAALTAVAGAHTKAKTTTVTANALS